MGLSISGWDLSFGMGLNFKKFRDGMQKFPGFSGWDGMGSGWDLTLLLKLKKLTRPVIINDNFKFS